MTTINCDGSSFAQTRFLGATIANFTSNIGWNSNRSSLTVTVYEDPCVGNTRVEYSQPWGVASTSTEADVFLPPQTGSPIYFQYGSFVFTGILQSWKQSNSMSGQSYTIQCSDVREVTDGTMLILSNYNGPSFGVPNLANVYGFMEAFEQVLGGPCTIDPSLTTLMGYISNIGYGGAQVNDIGMPWNLAMRALNNIYGLPISSSVNTTYGGQRMKFKGWHYSIDLTEVPIMPQWYRINSESLTLTEIIEKVCADAGFDYFVQLVPNRTTNTLIIKFKTVSRYASSAAAEAIDVENTFPPNDRLSIGTITDVIGNGTTQSPILGQWVEDNERGVELRNETSNAVLVGENRHDIWQTTASSLWPFWGVDSNNNLLIGSGTDDSHSVLIDSSSWGVSLSYYRLSVAELRMALGGQELWAAYIYAVEPAKAAMLGIVDYFTTLGDSSSAFSLLKALNGDALPPDLDSTSFNNAQAAAVALTNAGGSLEAFTDYISRIFGHISEIAQSMFGKKYIVSLNNICKMVDSSTSEIFLNWEPTSTAWPETPYVLGLATDSPGLEMFRDDDGRVQCFVYYANAHLYDLSGLSPDDYYYEGNSIWVKANLDSLIYWTDFANRTGPYALVDLAGPIYAKHGTHNVLHHRMGAIELLSQRLGYTTAQILNIWNPLSSSVGSNQNFDSVGRLPVMPHGAAIPLKSNTLTYGPWIATASGNAYGPDGKCEFEKDTSFAPWNFGSTTNMGVAALTQVNSRITFTQVTEYGSLNAAGYPTSNLGSILMAGGPNITGITVNIGDNGVKTSYEFRTYTPKFGVLAKERIDAFRKFSLLQSKIRRNFNNAFTKTRNILASNRELSEIKRSLLDSPKFANFSPHQLLAATVKSADDEVRTHVISGETRQEIGHLFNNWNNSAAISLNGIFRPFASFIGGGTDMSTFGNPTNNKWYSEEQVAPVDGEEHIPINVTTLNPFQNSASVFGFGSTSSGHDIEYIVRDTSFPVNLSVRNPTDNYGSIYRAIGLRGPLVISGWGFDIHNKPVPNSLDDSTLASSERYPNKASLKFKDNFLRKPDNWKTGPLDVRWDEERKVWTSPSSFKVSMAIPCDYIQPGETGKVRLVLDTHQLDPVGDEATGTCSRSPEKNVTTALNMCGHFVRPNWTTYGYYDTTEEQFVIFNAPECMFKCTANQDNVPCEGVSPGTEEATPVTAISMENDYFDVVDMGDIVISNILNQPYSSGDTLITQPLSYNSSTGKETHYIIKGSFASAVLLSSVSCNEDGGLEVCDRIVRFEGHTCPEDCPT